LSAAWLRAEEKGPGSYEYMLSRLCSFREDIPIVFSTEQFIFVAVKERIQVYDWSLRQLKEISNYLSEVIGIEPLGPSILVYGIDQLSRNILLVVDSSLSIAATVNLILKDSKYIKSIRTLPNPTRSLFLCRGEKYTTLFELTDNYEPNELQDIRADFQGYSLDLDPSLSLFLLTDAYRFLAVYRYSSTQSFLPVARHVASVEVNDQVLLNKALLLGDKQGVISVLEYNFESPQEAVKMQMTKVGCLRVGEEVSTLCRVSGRTVLIGTAEGRIGQVDLIAEEDFQLLRRVEEQVLESP
jgi:hypothetical protein